jgi:YVTN family beta-propeller protein
MKWDLARWGIYDAFTNSIYSIMLFLLQSALLCANLALAQIQAPALPGAPPISSQDRIYTGDQTSNTVTVIKPSTNEVLGTIFLGDERLSDILGPQYLNSINSHGLGFSRDGKYICSISVTTNTVTVIRTLDNGIQSQTFAERATHEAFFSADNRTVWVASRGTSHVDVIDGISGGVIGNITTAPGPSKVLFSPDGKTAYVNHIKSASLSIIDVEKRQVIQEITGLADVFSSDMMLSADGYRIWLAHKMAGLVTVIDLQQQKIVSVLDTGLETNHPNFVVMDNVTYGFVTVAGLNETKAYRQESPSEPPVYIGAIKSSGVQPHPIWPSPDNTRLYIGNEHSDSVDVVDPRTLQVLCTLHVGQESQSLVYVAGAVTSGDGTKGLGRQGLGYRVENKALPVGGTMNGSALVTVRAVDGLDMVQYIGNGLMENTTYVASASCYECKGTQIPLLRFSGKPTAKGCAVAPQVLGFFQFFGVYDIESAMVNPA